MVNDAPFANEQDWDEIGIEDIGLESIMPDYKNGSDYDSSSEYESQKIMSRSDKLRVLKSLNIDSQASENQNA